MGKSAEKLTPEPDHFRRVTSTFATSSDGLILTASDVRRTSNHDLFRMETSMNFFALHTDDPSIPHRHVVPPRLPTFADFRDGWGGHAAH